MILLLPLFRYASPHQIMHPSSCLLDHVRVLLSRTVADSIAGSAGPRGEKAFSSALNKQHIGGNNSGKLFSASSLTLLDRVRPSNSVLGFNWSKFNCVPLDTPAALLPINNVVRKLIVDYNLFRMIIVPIYQGWHFPSTYCTNKRLHNKLQRAPAFGRLAPLLPTVCRHLTTRPSRLQGSQRNVPPSLLFLSSLVYTKWKGSNWLRFQCSGQFNFFWGPEENKPKLPTVLVTVDAEDDRGGPSKNEAGSGSGESQSQASGDTDIIGNSRPDGH